MKICNIIEQISKKTLIRKHVFYIYLYTSISFLYLFLGRINGDEGWYLYASKMVYSGNLPYIDFSYTQSPLLPYVFGITQLLFGPDLYIGRLTSIFFGVLVCVLVYKTTLIVCKDNKSNIALALLCFNPFYIYFSTITKTYALTSFFIMLSTWIILSPIFRKNARIFLSIFFMCMAIAVRISVFPALIVLIIYIIYLEKKNYAYILWLMIVCMSSLALVFFPFLLINKDAVIFNVIEYHLHRSSWDLATVINNRLINLFYMSIVFFPVSIILFINAYLGAKNRIIDIKLIYLYSIIVSIFITQFFFINPTYAEYFVILFPITVILVEHGINSLNHNRDFIIRLTYIAIFCGLLFQFAIGSGLNLSYSVNLLENRLPIEEVKDISEYIKSNIPQNSYILTFYTDIAIEAKRDVLHGFEMGIFSYYENMSSYEAKKYKIINNDIMINYIVSKSAYAILLSDNHVRKYKNYIEKNYYLARTMDNWLGEGENISIYLINKSTIPINTSDLSLH